MNVLKLIGWFAGIGLLLQSCTAAAFDKAHPSNVKSETEFPKEMLGNWKATQADANFYVDYLEFEGANVTYEMSDIAPGSPSTIALHKDSVEIRKMKGGYVFNIAGEGLWLCFIVKIPSADKLEVYGFDADAKTIVEKVEEENTDEGITFIKYFATEKEWAKLLKSKALKKMASFDRIP